MLCRTQEQQLQAYAHQTRAIIDMAAQQAEDRARLMELLARRTEDGTPLPAPSGEAERPFTVAIPKMTLGDDIKAFLQVFEVTINLAEDDLALPPRPNNNGAQLPSLHPIFSVKLTLSPPCTQEEPRKATVVALWQNRHLLQSPLSSLTWW